MLRVTESATYNKLGERGWFLHKTERRENLLKKLRWTYWVGRILSLLHKMLWKWWERTQHWQSTLLNLTLLAVLRRNFSLIQHGWMHQWDVKVAYTSQKARLRGIKKIKTKTTTFRINFSTCDEFLDKRLWWPKSMPPHTQMGSPTNMLHGPFFVRGFGFTV